MSAARPDMRTLHASILLLEKTSSASALSRGHSIELRARSNDTYTARALANPPANLCCVWRKAACTSCAPSFMRSCTRGAAPTRRRGCVQMQTSTRSCRSSH
eukprot:scaffold90631_cov69-Phaeocystis_antarctica.AAC.5